MTPVLPGLDRRVPVVVVRIGQYPFSHSPWGTVRSFGRLGVPVYAMVEGRHNPTTASHYLTGAFVRPTTGSEPAEHLVDILRGVGEEVGRRSVAVPTDDESAVLLAEHTEELSPFFLIPPVPANLPRLLADKGELHRICRDHGIPSPYTATPADRDELVATGRAWGYPLVLKNLAPFTRLAEPVVSHSTLVRDERELLALTPTNGPLSVLAQEYLPAEHSEDWFTHLCCGPGGEPLAVFTGLKERDWPPGGGFTTLARTVGNPELADLAAGLCKKVGFAGVADLDWRLDLRDHRYKLVDFNPRQGAQFRLFETADGLDVVRALHLSLTGRPVPQGPVLPRNFRVGRPDLLAALATARSGHRLPHDLLPRRATERAWLCRDDAMPLVVDLARTARTAPLKLARRLLRA
ncbi:ATP-grasp domain-containing protein [Kitasatospora sp. DSM 101779]|uniref:carboxylate--amine ligase n=1 Tax=Kitasatospora sp. DSM 101779 TaxID=2853165 RepID=UPI0021DAA15C|nr:ATP-grasp domain-containing protein [Kitasatospora sp. DSM 101779]MCU7821715.1 ATP-grasp domain-containing protein [Kitasatospora sp. DSM 101779]